MAVALCSYPIPQFLVILPLWTQIVRELVVLIECRAAWKAEGSSVFTEGATWTERSIQTIGW